jgi:ribonuclease R
LALSAYAHFTSPIRRYPDLLVHRGISHLVEGGKPGAFLYKPPKMELLGKSCSMLERQAEAASRHVENRHKCIYIQEHVGGEFDGVITGVTHFGLFVMLNEFYVEGLIHVTNLGNDYYHSEHGGLRLTGEHTGNSFGLGDAVRVKISKVNVEEARVDLQLVVNGEVAAPENSGQRKQAKKQRSAKKQPGKQAAGKKTGSKKKAGKKRRRKR